MIRLAVLVKIVEFDTLSCPAAPNDQISEHRTYLQNGFSVRGKGLTKNIKVRKGERWRQKWEGINHNKKILQHTGNYMYIFQAVSPGQSFCLCVKKSLQNEYVK